MPLQYFDWADDAALSLIYWLAGLVSIAVLLDEGIRHILRPASSKLASWLEVLNFSRHLPSVITGFSSEYTMSITGTYRGYI